METKTIILIVFGVAAVLALGLGLGLGLSSDSSVNLEPWFETIEIQTRQGPLLGRKYQKIKDSPNSNQPFVYEFYNIPYAAPPINQNRWLPPMFDENNSKYPTWTETRDGTVRGHRCIESEGKEEAKADMDYTWSEDCLFLNIGTQSFRVEDPNNDSENLYPVLVYFHGGGFQSGSGAYITADTQILAGEQKMVVVTINYRLGVFGFAGFENEFPPNSGKMAIGNMGLMDQYAALQWVRNNIHLFGGDKDKIMVTGESAGAESSMTHMVWEDSRVNNNLRGAIPMSLPNGIPYVSAKHAETMLYRLSDAFDCTEPSNSPNPRKKGEIRKDCLDNVKAQDIENQFVLPITRQDFADRLVIGAAQFWPPTVDGNIVNGDNVNEFASGKYGEDLPPILAGAAKNEGEVVVNAVTYESNGELNKIWYNIFTKVLLHNIDEDWINEYYPWYNNSETETYDSVSYCVGDALFDCPSRYALKKSKSKSNNYFYNWQRPIGVPRQNSRVYARCSMENSTVACHSDQGQWLFGDNEYVDYYQKNRDKRVHIKSHAEAFDARYPEGVEIDQADVDLGVAFRKMIYDFMVNEGFDNDQWPAFSEETDYSIRLFKADGTWEDSTEYRTEFCDAWDDLDIYARVL